MITKVHDKLPILGMDKPQRGLERLGNMKAFATWNSPVRVSIDTNYEENTKSITFEFPTNCGDMTVTRFHNILIEAIDRLGEDNLDKFVKDHYALRDMFEKVTAKATDELKERMYTSNRPIDEVKAYVMRRVTSVEPKRIVRNGIALIVFWDDGTKTVVKCHDEDFDPEKGLAMALARKVWGRCGTVNLLKTIEEQEGKEKKALQNTDKQKGAGVFVDATPDQLKELARLRKLKEAMNG